jgi:hypothetical protein
MTLKLHLVLECLERREGLSRPGILVFKVFNLSLLMSGAPNPQFLI